MALDTLLNHRLTLLRVVERALHEDGEWTLRIGAAERPALVLTSDTGVAFVATMPQCAGSIEIAFNGEVCFVGRHVEVIEGDTITYSLTLSPEPVALG